MRPGFVALKVETYWRLPISNLSCLAAASVLLHRVAVHRLAHPQVLELGVLRPELPLQVFHHVAAEVHLRHDRLELSLSRVLRSSYFTFRSSWAALAVCRPRMIRRARS